MQSELQGFAARYWEYRHTLKWSVKRKLEGEGLSYDDELRKDAYHDAVVEVLEALQSKKASYNDQTDTLMIEGKERALKPYLCMLTRYRLYDYFRRKNYLPVMDLDSPETQREIHLRQDVRDNPGDKQQDHEFHLHRQTVLTKKNNQVITDLLAGYKTGEICKRMQISQQALYKRKQTIIKVLYPRGVKIAKKPGK